MFLVNSRLDLFIATLSRFVVLVHITLAGYLFSRSYKVILPSSLTRVISRTLAFSANLPVAVSGTDIIISHLRSFSWQCGVCAFLSVESPHHASVYNAVVDFPATATYTLKLALPVASAHSLLRSSAVQTILRWYRNINLSSIAYAFRPQLRVRLTPRGRACRGKP